MERMKFPFDYWEININNLNKGEEKYQKLLKRFNITQEEDCEIDDKAQREFGQELYLKRGDFPHNIDQIINKCRITNAIEYITEKYKLDYDEFCCEIEGNSIAIYYKSEII